MDTVTGMISQHIYEYKKKDCNSMYQLRHISVYDIFTYNAYINPYNIEYDITV